MEKIGDTGQDKKVTVKNKLITVNTLTISDMIRALDVLGFKSFRFYKYKPKTKEVLKMGYNNSLRRDDGYYVFNRGAMVNFLNLLSDVPYQIKINAKKDEDCEIIPTETLIEMRNRRIKKQTPPPVGA